VAAAWAGVPLHGMRRVLDGVLFHGQVVLEKKRGVKRETGGYMERTT